MSTIVHLSTQTQAEPHATAATLTRGRATTSYSTLITHARTRAPDTARGVAATSTLRRDVTPKTAPVSIGSDQEPALVGGGGGNRGGEEEEERCPYLDFVNLRCLPLLGS